MTEWQTSSLGVALKASIKLIVKVGWRFDVRVQLHRVLQSGNFLGKGMTVTKSRPHGDGC